MTQGVFIYGSRPPTKKKFKAQVEEVNLQLQSGNKLMGADPYSVVIEATSLFGNEFDGSLATALSCGIPTCPQARGDKEPHQHLGPFYIVGPDPRTSRKWYAKLEFDKGKGEWIVE